MCCSGKNEKNGGKKGRKTSVREKRRLDSLGKCCMNTAQRVGLPGQICKKILGGERGCRDVL